MRRVTTDYLAEHLVEPKTLLPLSATAETLRSSAGAIPLIDGVPVFTGLYVSPQWRDEMQQTAAFAADYAKRYTTQPNMAVWCQPWLHDDLLTDQSRTVCIAGSFSDDVPHVTKGHKFNVDLFAHEYTKLPPIVMDAQNTVFVACWAEHLPFSTGTVDYIYSRNALDHFESPIKCVRDVHRVLKEGGLFILAVYYDSSFFDAHETGIVDAEFVENVIDPLFERVHVGFLPAEPTGPVLAGTDTRFMQYVGRKRTGARLAVSDDLIARAELIGSSFHKALYEREHHNGAGAMEFYRTALSVPPAVRSDAWRQLHACIDLLAMTDKDAMVAAAQQIRDVGLTDTWAPIANLTLARYGLDLKALPKGDFEIDAISCPDCFDNWKWLVVLAACVETHGLSEDAEQLREQARRLSPDAAMWLDRPTLS